MVSIRLARGGAKKRPFYRIVATDRRNKRDGRSLEQLGFFNPYAAGEEEHFRIDAARLQYWLQRGAQPSQRVRHLVARQATSLPVPEVSPSVSPPVKEPPPGMPEDVPAAKTDVSDGEGIATKQQEEGKGGI